MRWEAAALEAIEELSKSHPEWAVAYLALMLRAGHSSLIQVSAPSAGVVDDAGGEGLG